MFRVLKREINLQICLQNLLQNPLLNLKLRILHKEGAGLDLANYSIVKNRILARINKKG